MDAFSITASVVAVGQAADRLAALLATLKGASAEILSLADDVRDTKAVFQGLEEVLRDQTPWTGFLERKENLIKKIVEDAKARIANIQSFLEKRICRSTNSAHDDVLVVRRFGRLVWTWEKERLERFRQDLRDKRLTVATLLAAIHACVFPDKS
jgi:hypothetical protein